jgi:hypothetical protein
MEQFCKNIADVRKAVDKAAKRSGKHAELIPKLKRANRTVGHDNAKRRVLKLMGKLGLPMQTALLIEAMGNPAISCHAQTIEEFHDIALCMFLMGDWNYKACYAFKKKYRPEYED